MLQNSLGTSIQWIFICQIERILTINLINRSLYALFPYWPVLLRNLISNQSCRFQP